MHYLLLAISTITAAGKSVIFKKVGTSSSSLRQLLLSNFILNFVAAMIPFASIGFNIFKLFNISLYSLIFSVIIGLCIILTYISQIRAMAEGTVSASLLVFACGFLIPSIFSHFFLDEKISLIQLICIFVLLGGLFLVVNPEKNAKFSAKWFFYAFASMFGTGINAVFQKLHQRSEYAGEISSLLTLAFLIAAILLIIPYFFVHKQKNEPNVSLRSVGVSSLSGLFAGTVTFMNLILISKIPAVVLFPVYNIGSLVISGIISAIIYNERISKKQLVGFIVECTAILMIGIF